MFRITVMSRKDAVRFADGPATGEATAMVSIGTPGQRYANRPERGAAVQKICYAEFFDITPEFASDRFPVMPDAMAHRIARFVITQQRLGMRHLVIHCDFGQSRSAGVAKAVAAFYGIPESDIKYAPDSCPNPFVTDAIANALNDWYRRHGEPPPTKTE